MLIENSIYHLSDILQLRKVRISQYLRIQTLRYKLRRYTLKPPTSLLDGRLGYIDSFIYYVSLKVLLVIEILPLIVYGYFSPKVSTRGYPFFQLLKTVWLTSTQFFQRDPRSHQHPLNRIYESSTVRWTIRTFRNILVGKSRLN